MLTYVLLFSHSNSESTVSRSPTRVSVWLMRLNGGLEGPLLLLYNRHIYLPRDLGKEIVKLTQ